MLPTPEQLAEFTLQHGPDKRQALVKHACQPIDHQASTDHLERPAAHDEGVNYAGTRKTITDGCSSLQENGPSIVGRSFSILRATGPDGFLLGVNWRAISTPARRPDAGRPEQAQVFLGGNRNAILPRQHQPLEAHDAYGLASFF